ncbi:hypothetical protein HELRODRAFT_182595 [Helobdella robusta]|uniref:Uncharacterized protein n=1 Tax=Helobdella robusta TaxID=6412 RepID=T1FIF7_HELRO|nr:hypothetical protein HELRODRAFT_182595 [Helobdella robusta]ESN90767.1 hypothetical protein HELRODRAFT_182595 [Helobdella robusta]
MVMHGGCLARKATITYNVSSIARINDIFSNTEFNGLKGYSFVVKELFSTESWNNFCLAHLYTYLPFGDMLGLGHIGDREICENVGITTMKSKTGLLPTIQSDLVTAHVVNVGANAELMALLLTISTEIKQTRDQIDAKIEQRSAAIDAKVEQQSAKIKQTRDQIDAEIEQQSAKIKQQSIEIKQTKDQICSKIEQQLKELRELFDAKTEQQSAVINLKIENQIIRMENITSKTEQKLW